MLQNRQTITSINRQTITSINSDFSSLVKPSETLLNFE